MYKFFNISIAVSCGIFRGRGSGAEVHLARKSRYPQGHYATMCRPLGMSGPRTLACDTVDRSPWGVTDTHTFDLRTRDVCATGSGGSIGQHAAGHQPHGVGSDNVDQQGTVNCSS